MYATEMKFCHIMNFCMHIFHTGDDIANRCHDAEASGFWTLNLQGRHNSESRMSYELCLLRACKFSTIVRRSYVAVAFCLRLICGCVYETRWEICNRNSMLSSLSASRTEVLGETLCTTMYFVSTIVTTMVSIRLGQKWIMPIRYKIGLYARRPIWAV